MPGIVLDAGTVTPRICPSGATDRVCACTCMHVLGEPITMKFEEPAFLERWAFTGRRHEGWVG